MYAYVGGTVALCVSTTGDKIKKDWPAECFAELADRLIEDGVQLIFTGVNEHQEKIRKIVGIVPTGGYVNRSGHRNSAFLRPQQAVEL